MHATAAVEGWRDMDGGRARAARAKTAAVRAMVAGTGPNAVSRDAAWEEAKRTGTWAETAEGRARRRAEQTSSIQVFDAFSVAFVTLVGAVCALTWVIAPILVPDDALDGADPDGRFAKVNVSGADGSRWWEILNVSGRPRGGTSEADGEKESELDSDSGSGSAAATDPSAA